MPHQGVPAPHSQLEAARDRIQHGLSVFNGSDPDDGSLPPDMVAEAVLVRFTREEQRQFALDWIRSRHDEGGFVAGAWAQQAAHRDLDADALHAEAGEPGSDRETQWVRNRVEAVTYMLDETGQAGSPHMLPVMRAAFAHLSQDRFDESVAPLVRECAENPNLPVGYVEPQLEPLLHEELSARRAAANG